MPRYAMVAAPNITFGQVVEVRNSITAILIFKNPGRRGKMSRVFREAMTAFQARALDRHASTLSGMVGDARVQDRRAGQITE